MCLILLYPPVRHAAGRHRGRGGHEEGGATCEDGCQPGRRQQVGGGATGFFLLHIIFVIFQSYGNTIR